MEEMINIVAAILIVWKVFDIVFWCFNHIGYIP